MAPLILPGQTTQQPQYPAPLRPEYANNALLSVNFGAGPFNSVTNENPVGAYQEAVNAQGKAYKNVGAGGSLSWPVKSVFGTDKWTLLFHFYLPVYDANARGLLQIASNASAASTFPFLLLQSNGSNGLALYVDAAFRITAPNIFASGTYHAIAVTYDGATLTLIRNGSVIGTYASTNLDGSGGHYTSDTLWVGTGYQFAADIEVLALNYVNSATPVAQLQTLTAQENLWQIFSAQPRRIWIPAAGGGTAALTGASATGAAGSSGVAHSQPTSGSAATSTAGTAGASVTVALSGAAVTGAAGTVSTVADAATGLTGAAVTASAGTAGVSLSLAVVGASVGSAVGAVGIVRTTAVSGAAATGAAGSASVSFTTAIAGSASTASAGTVGTTGNASAALSGAVVNASSGALGVSRTYAITGQSASASAGAVSATAGSGAALDGSQAASAAGTVARSIAVGLTGAACAVSAGGLSLSQVLAGSQIVVTPGAFGAAVALQLTGASAYAYAGIVAGSGGDGGTDVQYPLAGLTQGHPLAGLHQGYPLEEQTQMYPLAGLR